VVAALSHSAHRPRITELMDAGTGSLEACGEHAEHPKRKASRDTVRLGSHGLTLLFFGSIIVHLHMPRLLEKYLLEANSCTASANDEAFHTYVRDHFFLEYHY
jgi:hypothetical protein